jgi:agmatine/peptidylarginine deiminase
VLAVVGEDPAPWLAPLAEHVAASGVALVLVRERGVSEARVARTLRAWSPEVRAATVALPIAVDTVWARDWGPLAQLGAGAPRWLDADYLHGRPLDEAAAPAITAALAPDAAARIDAVVHGGAIAADGAGLCVATEGFAAAARWPTPIEPAHAQFVAALGCTRLVLVPGLEREPTQHVDLLVQFVAGARVMVAAIEPSAIARTPAHERDAIARDAAALDRVAAQLEADATGQGQPLELVRVPLRWRDGVNVQSWINGLRLPDRFVAPSFRRAGAPEPEETRAMQALVRALAPFPVERVDVGELGLLGGAIHCVTLGLHGAPAPAAAAGDPTAALAPG